MKSLNSASWLARVGTVVGVLLLASSLGLLVRAQQEPPERARQPRLAGHLAADPGEGQLRAVGFAPGQAQPFARVQGQELIFDSGPRIPLKRNIVPELHDRGVVTVENGFDRTVTLRSYDATGGLLTTRKFPYQGYVHVTPTGFILATDSSEGYGTKLELYSSGGELIKAIRPFDGGYSRIAVASGKGRILIHLVPEDKEISSPKVLLLREADGALLLDQPVDLSNSHAMYLGGDLFVIHHTSRRDGEFVSELSVFRIDGQLVRTVNTYSLVFALDESNGRLFVGDREQVKRIDLADGKVVWTKAYTGIYDRDTLPTPDDIPAGFGLRSVDIQLHADEEVVAVLMSQSSFNPDAPRYEGELLFLSASSGRVIDKVYMGARNRVLRMQRDARGLHLVRDSGVDTYELDPSPRQ